MEVSEAKARLRLEVERVTREKEEELAEVHQRSESKSIVLLVPCLEQWLSYNHLWIKAADEVFTICLM